MIPTPPELFNVVLFFMDGSQHYEKRYVPSEEAVATAADFSRRPAALAGFISKIMITDCGDSCCLLWEHDRGIVFPPREQGR